MIAEAISQLNKNNEITSYCLVKISLNNLCKMKTKLNIYEKQKVKLEWQKN